MKIIVGARPSPLSQAQVWEVFEELKAFRPEVVFFPLWISSRGDKDKTTSLKYMQKNDFFTFELDEALLQKKCDIAIHSAKDLPLALREGLTLLALTMGVDSRDSLVMSPNFLIPSLKKNARIGCSSKRREEAILSLRKDFIPVDIRGTIGERLNLMTSGEIDGLIVAEAALIRLHLKDINRVILETPTDPLQGKLAILGRKEDKEMEALFQPLRDCEKITW